jgi:DNA helicase-2/ATP-dependent DNA helicase PcrA
MDLTAAQNEAVLSPGNTLQILACAGSGKTEVLARRVVNHLLNGVPPECIVAFTFTEKAAGELKERIESRASEADERFRSMPPGAAGLFVGTIHSYCLRTLQQLGGIYEVFDPLTEEREWALLQRFARRLGVVDLMDRTWPGKQVSVKRAVEVFLRNMSVVYNERISASVLRESTRDFAEVAARYSDLLEQMQLLSFDQMIEAACDELGPEGRLHRALEGKIRAVFVDEYQDLNRAQEEILRRLIEMGASLTVVGDDDQAIYQWRGGEVSLFLGFAARHKGAELKTLSENYRSAPSIVKVSSDFAKSIRERRAKSMVPIRTEAGPSIEFIVADTAQDEAKAIVARVGSLQRAGHRLSDMAVLFRSVRTSVAPLVEALRREDIPYALVGKLSILDYPEMALVARIFVWWAGGRWMPNDEEEVVTEEKLAADIVGLTATSESDAIRVVSALARMGEEIRERGVRDVARTYMEVLRLVGLPVSGRDRQRQEQRLGQFSHLLAEFENSQRRAAPVAFKYPSLTSAAEEEAEDVALQFTGPAIEKSTHADVRPAVTPGQAFVWRLRVFLEAFGSQAVEEAPNRPTLDDDALNIMTVHQSKGLEFPIVFVPALVDPRFPSSRMGQKQSWYVPQDLFGVERYEGREDDERRLFYVAMTRAREMLVLSAFSQYSGGERAKPSRFIETLSEGKHTDCLSKLGECNPRVSVKRNGPGEVLVADFGQILAFSECPYKYYLRHVCGFEPPVAPELGFGRFLHHVIAELARRAREGRAPTKADVDEILARSFYLPFAGPIAREKLFKAAKRRLTNYVKNHGRELLRTIEPERPLEIPMESARVTGRIDLLLRAESGAPDEVELVDFKTAVNRPPSKTHQNQLRMYGEAVRKLGMRPVKLVIYDLDGEQGGAIQVEESEAQVKAFRSELNQWINGMRAGNFEPKGRRTQCAPCDFALLCETRAIGKRE